MAESSTPEMTPGKIFLTMVMNTRLILEMFSSMPSIMRPNTPTSTEKARISSVQVMPIFADLRRDFWDSTDMNRMMMWGMPK